MTNWHDSVAPVARLLGRRVVEQLFERAANDARLVATIAEEVYTREGQRPEWTKLDPDVRARHQRMVEATIRRLGQHIGL